MISTFRLRRIAGCGVGLLLAGLAHGQYTLSITPASPSTTAGRDVTLAASITPKATQVKWQTAPVGTDPVSGTWNDLTGATALSVKITKAQVDDYLDYRVGASADGVDWTWSTAVTLVVKPGILNQPSPASTTLESGQTFSAKVVPVAGQGQLSYLWQFSPVTVSPAESDWRAVPGEVYDLLRLTNVKVADSGLYRVVLINSAGLVTNSNPVVLTVTPPVVAPRIGSQPTAVAVAAGQTASFTVVATGYPTPTYQWQKLSGATWSTFRAGSANATTGAATATLTIASVLPADAAQYRVVVTNSAGAVASDPVTLTVEYAPVILTQPADARGPAGSDATLTVVAEGDPAPTYQWQFYNTGTSTWVDLADDAHVGGSATDTLTLTTLVTADGGSYRVEVLNDRGEAYSRTVALTIDPDPLGTPPDEAPVFLSQPRDLWAVSGQTVVLYAVASGVPAATLQWQKQDSGGLWQDLSDGASVNGSTTTLLTLLEVDSTSAGLYRAVATNSVDATNSETARLTVAVTTNLWSGASGVGSDEEGWKYYPAQAGLPAGWFDWFFSTSANPAAVFHSTHGWLYATGSDAEASVWLWAADLGWFWTNAATYPYLYVAEDAAWFWYLRGSLSPRVFYDFGSGTWLEL